MPDDTSASAATALREIRFYEAIREAISGEMDADPDVLLMGESIQAGTWPYTKGLAERFGVERVIDTPIAETGLVGAAFGAAQAGLRPIIDFMYAGFSYQAGSEVFMQVGAYHFLHGSKHPVPMTMIGTFGVGKRVGHDHAVPMYGALMHHPGLKICVPSNPADAKGLMTAAIRDNNPVFFLWHTHHLTMRGDVPEGEHLVPLGKAAVVRDGTDVTIVTLGQQVQHAVAAAGSVEDKISVEIIDARSVEPFDIDTVLKSVEKTTRLVIVDEDWGRAGFAAEVSALMMEQGYDLLDAPVLRVCHPAIPIPGGYMDSYTMPTPERIVAALEEVCA